MKAFSGAVLGSLSAFTLTEHEKPLPGPGEVRIDVKAAALGFVDGLIVQGRYQIAPPLPYVPGGEIAGVVDRTGAGVAGLMPGDRVVTWQLGGGLAECVLAPQNQVDRMPEGIDFTSAAAMLVDYQTAHYALFRRADLKEGETVLVAGAAGGVGSAAVQLARRAGAHVLAVVSTPAKGERARTLGANGTIAADSEDMRKVIRELAPRGVVDVIVDPVGGPSFEKFFRALAKEGRHLVIGFAQGGIPTLPANLTLLKSASLIGVDIRHFVSAYPDEARRVRLSLMSDVAAGLLAPPDCMIFTLDQAGAALAATSRRDKRGKIVVVQSD